MSSPGVERWDPCLRIKGAGSALTTTATARRARNFERKFMMRWLVREVEGGAEEVGEEGDRQAVGTGDLLLK